jgi:hypothetical protein
MTTIKLSPEAKKLLKNIKKMRPWFAKADDEEIIYQIMLDWIKLDGVQSVDDWIREEFF